MANGLVLKSLSPKREQSLVEWGEILSVCLSALPSLLAKGSGGHLKGSESLPEGTEGMPEGSEGQLEGSEGQLDGLRAGQRGLRARRRGLRACQRGQCTSEGIGETHGQRDRHTDLQMEFHPILQKAS